MLIGPKKIGKWTVIANAKSTTTLITMQAGKIYWKADQLSPNGPGSPTKAKPPARENALTREVPHLARPGLPVPDQGAGAEAQGDLRVGAEAVQPPPTLAKRQHFSRPSKPL